MSTDLIEQTNVVELDCDVNALAAALAAVAPVVPKRSPKPILRGVLLTCDPEAGAALAATDLEVSVRVRVVGVFSPRPVRAVLPPARLQQILTGAHGRGGGRLTIAVSDSGTGAAATVRGAGFRFELPLDDAALFPEPPAFPSKGGAKVGAAELRALVRRTVYATDPESTRYALGGCLLTFDGGRLIMAATDGRRLAEAAADASLGDFQPPGKATVVPLKALKLVAALLDDADPPVELALGAQAAHVRCDRFTLYSRLVEGRFPHYQDIIPAAGDMTGRAAGTAGEWLWAVSQAAIATSEETRGIDFDFSDGRVTLRASAADRGSGEVEASVAYEGEPAVVTLDSRYLTDPLRALPADAGVTVRVRDAGSPVLLTLDQAGETPDPVAFRCVAMPLTRD